MDVEISAMLFMKGLENECDPGGNTCHWLPTPGM
jgi:hypothetical protein